MHYDFKSVFIETPELSINFGRLYLPDLDTQLGLRRFTTEKELMWNLGLEGITKEELSFHYLSSPIDKEKGYKFQCGDNNLESVAFEILARQIRTRLINGIINFHYKYPDWVDYPARWLIAAPVDMTEKIKIIEPNRRDSFYVVKSEVSYTITIIRQVPLDQTPDVFKDFIKGLDF